MPIWSTALLKYAEASGLTVDNLFRNVSDSSVILCSHYRILYFGILLYPPSSFTALKR